VGTLLIADCWKMNFWYTLVEALADDALPDGCHGRHACGE